MSRQLEIVQGHAQRLEKALDKLSARHVGDDRRMVQWMELKVLLSSVLETPQIVTSWGERRIQCIKVLRTHFDLPLAEAKKMTDVTPFQLPKASSALVTDLKAAGAVLVQ